MTTQQKYVYVLNGSEDGNLGCYTSPERAINSGIDYVTQNQGTLSPFAQVVRGTVLKTTLDTLRSHKKPTNYIMVTEAELAEDGSPDFYADITRYTLD